MHLEMEITRSELEHLINDVIEKCRGLVDQALQDAQINSSDIDRIIFVGGPTRMPMVRKFNDLWRTETIEVADAALGMQLPSRKALFRRKKTI